MTQTLEKDIVVEAIPEENKAFVKAKSSDGMIFMKRHFKDINPVSEKAVVSGVDINVVLDDARENEISFSFVKFKK